MCVTARYTRIVTLPKMQTVTFLIRKNIPYRILAFKLEDSIDFGSFKDDRIEAFDSMRLLHQIVQSREMR
jgi:hypothetical protein